MTYKLSNKSWKIDVHTRMFTSRLGSGRLRKKSGVALTQLSLTLVKEYQHYIHI